jgi:hypothetical protein
MRCLACHADKDLLKFETYPYSGPHDNITQDRPLEPLCCVQCEGRTPGEWGMAIMCNECFHRLSENTQGVDMWISEACWETLQPKTPFSQLPPIKQNGDRVDYRPKSYDA